MFQYEHSDISSIKMLDYKCISHQYYYYNDYYVTIFNGFIISAVETKYVFQIYIMLLIDHV